jgi:hypothetical protein
VESEGKQRSQGSRDARCLRREPRSWVMKQSSQACRSRLCLSCSLNLIVICVCRLACAYSGLLDLSSILVSASVIGGSVHV